MKRLKIYISLLLLILFSATTFAQEDKFKAIFIYNFSKYIEWPTNQKTDFSVTVMGNSPVYDELVSISGKMKVGTKNIVVTKISNAAEISFCHILFIPANKSAELPMILEKAKSLGILVVCDKSGNCLKGASISFALKNGNLGFEISKKNIESCGLIVNGTLLALGINAD